MKFVQFIRDELVTKEPVIQFNFGTLEELTTHPYIAAFTEDPHFMQFAMQDKFFLLAERKNGMCALIVGFIYGKDRHHFDLPIWKGSVVERPKAASVVTHIDVPRKASVHEANTRPAAIPEKLDKWVTYWQSGEAKIIEGRGINDAFARAGLDLNDTELDFYHLGDVPTYTWNSADRDWESNKARWRG